MLILTALLRIPDNNHNYLPVVVKSDLFFNITVKQELACMRFRWSL